MKTRLIASVIVGAAVVLGTSGCAMLAPQGTTIQYAPSDGMNVPDSSGPLQLRNVLIVANDEGTEGNLVAAIVNTTDDPTSLNIQVGEGSDAVSLTLRVRGGETLSLGTDETEPLLIEDLNTQPGATVPVFFQSGDGEGARTDIPVLNGDLEYLAPLVP
ncbi:DNA modification methylase [Microbacterium sp. NPDC089189]|uniref:DNA modification methylase n=1 Tax=Microbacterium sp. NPDC089189 TaxID=3154972 RepID=UPI00343CE8C4